MAHSKPDANDTKPWEVTANTLHEKQPSCGKGLKLRRASGSDSFWSHPSNILSLLPDYVKQIRQINAVWV